MVELRRSVARQVVVAGLLLQFVLTILQILQSYTLEIWMRRISNAEGEALLGTLALGVLLALVVPVARGRLWALGASIVLQSLLMLGMVPWLIRKFSQPEFLVQWTLNLSYCMVGAAAIAFGIVAILEVLGKARPSGWRAGSWGLTGQGVVVLAAVSAFVGLVIAGAGAAQRPPARPTVAGVADEVVLVSMHAMSFTPTRLVLPAGKRVGLLLTNSAMDEHSFDVDSQNIHVQVPGGSTGIAIVQVPASGQLPFRCAVPGHTEAGMTGVIVPG